MRHRSKILLVGACALIAILAVCFSRHRNDEPSYNGRTLSEWLNEYNPPQVQTAPNAWASPDATNRDQAEVAIRQIGTNALPCLLKWIDYQPKVERYRIYKWPSWARRGARKLLFGETGTDKGYTRALQARNAFQLLGPIAASAVPELTHHLTEKSPAVVRNAIEALGYIGPAAVPTMMNVVSNVQKYPEDAVFIAVDEMGTNAEPIVPIIARFIHQDIATQNSVMTLGWLTLNASLVVPALTEALTNRDSEVRGAAARALSHFGTNAKPAVPILTAATHDLNSDVRSSVTNALLKIAPETLTNSTPSQ